jgi:hypothetical protein
MQNKLEKYLSQIEKQLAALPVEQRQEELREIRSHLEMMIEENVARGCDADVAVSKALEQFGSADKLGKALRQSKPFAWLHYFRPIAALLLAFGVVIAWLFISKELQIFYVPFSFHWSWALMLIIAIFPLTGWAAEVIAPKYGTWSLAVIFYGILSIFIYVAFWKLMPIPKTYFLISFMPFALAGIAAFLGALARRKHVKRNHQ